MDKKTKMRKKLKRSAQETAADIYRDMTLLLETDNIMKWTQHPDYDIAKEICADYRHVSIDTVKIRIQVIVDLVKGKFYESIAQPTNQYYLAAIKGGYLKGNDVLLATNNLNK